MKYVLTIRMESSNPVAVKNIERGLALNAKGLSKVGVQVLSTDLKIEEPPEEPAKAMEEPEFAIYQ